jgi:hypothetical protein
MAQVINAQMRDAYMKQAHAVSAVPWQADRPQIPGMSARQRPLDIAKTAVGDECGAAKAFKEPEGAQARLLPHVLRVAVVASEPVVNRIQMRQHRLLK